MRSADRRLHAIAGAALEGRLDRGRLLALDSGQAIEELRKLPGIGPFYSHLILLRAVSAANGAGGLVTPNQLTGTKTLGTSCSRCEHQRSINRWNHMVRR